MRDIIAALVMIGRSMMPEIRIRLKFLVADSTLEGFPQCIVPIRMITVMRFDVTS